MPIKSPKSKGANAERELAKLLGDRLGISLQRNLEQWRSGGFDLLSDLPLAIEVKRCEQLQLNQWWKQALRQSQGGKIPVLCYRQSRQPWRIVVPLAWLTGLEFDPTAIATIDLDNFCQLIQCRLMSPN
jgi:hypothetical protein